MKALILNSGMGSRMGVLTSEHPKCMTEISSQETILSRQLRMLAEAGVGEVVMTTGLFDGVLVNYCRDMGLPLHFTFVNNPIYKETNYIYSIYCAREFLRNEDVLLMHGDLVFENAVLDAVMDYSGSCMTVSSTLPLPQKDFKAVLAHGKIVKVGIEFFSDAVAAQPLYKLMKADWNAWLDRIERFCESGQVKCYAENALNEIAGECAVMPMDVQDMLCCEIDNPEDLAVVTAAVQEAARRTAYMCFSTDMLHGGHFAILGKAKRLGRLIVGVMTDEAVASYRRPPLLPFEERKAMFENIAGVYRVVAQNSLSYRDNLRKYHPTYVVHGDDWREGFQRPVRDEVVSELSAYGGRLVEFPYASDSRYEALDRRARAEMSLPDMRIPRLRRALAAKGMITALGARGRITGLIAEKTVAYQDGEARQFDAIYAGSLRGFALDGRPVAEPEDLAGRFRAVEEILEATTKPIICAVRVGSSPEGFASAVRALERRGVSMVIAEDESVHTPDSLAGLCAMIAAGKRAQRTESFLICVRVDSGVLRPCASDALDRAVACAEAGADAILMGGNFAAPCDAREFLRAFRARNASTFVAAEPSAFGSVTEKELKTLGVNIVLYADQLVRVGYTAMRDAARAILASQSDMERDDIGASVDDILSLLPRED